MTFTRLGVIASIAISVTLPNTVARADSDNLLRFTQSVNGVNPCNSEIVNGFLDVLIVLNRHSTGLADTHVNLHGSFHGELTGSLGNTYQVSAEGQDEADVVSNRYDLPFHVNAVTEGSASNLTLDGTARVLVDSSGNPVGAGIVSLSVNCAG